MAWRMAGRGRQRERIVERIAIIDKQRLTSLDDWQTVVRPDVAGRLLFLLCRLFPGGVLLLVENVLCARKGRHPASVAQHRVPAAVVDVQVGAEYVVDRIIRQPGGL